MFFNQFLGSGRQSFFRVARLLLFCFILTRSVSVQAGVDLYSLSGSVFDEAGHALAGAFVSLYPVPFPQAPFTKTMTDATGQFSFSKIPEGLCLLRVTYMGYHDYLDSIQVERNQVVRVQLQVAANELKTLTVIGQASKTENMASSLSVETVDRHFLNTNATGSLMQSLSRLPGISSIDIGAAQSKPVIRGLGFNRVVVTENGVKHEAQEWGADHGLEINPFTVERVNIIKGPASLIYGANAIGGVINLEQLTVPAKYSTSGSLLMNGQTNNQLLSLAAKVSKRYNRFYFKANATITAYADYRVPTDSIEYLSYYFRLKNHRVRNTAGKDQNAGVTLGFVEENFSTHLSFSDYHSKSGFFANAHGLEIRNSSIDYDQSIYDIDLPYQDVNHFKFLSNTFWMMGTARLNMDLGFQRNFRQEFSEPTSHGYMPQPADSLERSFKKTTWTGNLRFVFPVVGTHEFTTGLNSEIQQNGIGGWGFILPAYNSSSGGIFLHDNIRLSSRWTINAGSRYDAGRIQTKAYYDWYQTPQDDGSDLYVQRAKALDRTFGNLSWGVGVAFSGEQVETKLNIGKSFRMPTAQELATNGINYHLYRYEKGDSSLHAEESYQVDLDVKFHPGRWDFEFSPFVNYFPNYIYLNPSYDYYEAEQVYYYSESEVFRTGGECVVSYKPVEQVKLTIDAEYIYSIQLTGTKKGFTLPFSPPFTSVLSVVYSPDLGKHVLLKPWVGIDAKWVAAQNNIVPPEKKTPGYRLFNLNAGSIVRLAGLPLQVSFQLNNVLNTRYYDHTSFYRLIEVPGLGRNLAATIEIPFGTK